MGRGRKREQPYVEQLPSRAECWMDESRVNLEADAGLERVRPLKEVKEKKTKIGLKRRGIEIARLSHGDGHGMQRAPDAACGFTRIVAKNPPQKNRGTRERSECTQCGAIRW